MSYRLLFALAFFAVSAPASAWPEPDASVRGWIVWTDEKVNLEFELRYCKVRACGAMDVSSGIDYEQRHANEQIKDLHAALYGQPLQTLGATGVRGGFATAGLPLATQGEFVAAGVGASGLRDRIEQEIKRDKKHDGNIVVTLSAYLTADLKMLRIDAKYRLYDKGRHAVRSAGDATWYTDPIADATPERRLAAWSADGALLFRQQLDLALAGTATLIARDITGFEVPKDAPVVSLWKVTGRLEGQQLKDDGKRTLVAVSAHHLVSKPSGVPIAPPEKGDGR
jgi:hypothetical protein